MAPTWEQPIGALLTRHCRACHGAVPQNLAPTFLRLDRYADSGGRSGAFSARERVASRVRSAHNPMPPPGWPALSACEIDVIVRWVARGAPEQ